MKPNDDINTELNELSPFLAKLREKEEGYTVPFNYFSVLADEVMDKCVAEKPVQNQVKVSPWGQVLGFLDSLLRPKFSLAFASIALFIVAVFFIVPRGNEVQVAQELFTEEEALAYIDENIEDFELELLEEDFAGEMDFIDVFEINEADLDQYIDDNVLQDLDETTLEELL